MNSAINYSISLIGFMFPLLLDEWLFARMEKKRNSYRVRKNISITVYILCGISIIMLIMGGYMTGKSYLLYFTVFALTILMFGFMYEISWIEVLFITSCGYALQHMGYAVYEIICYFMHWDGWSNLHSTLANMGVQLFVTSVIFFTIIRRNEYTGERKDPRMVILAAVILFCAVFLSLWTGETTGEHEFEEEIVLKVICRVYAVISCFLVIWLEYAVSRMNMIQKQKEFMEQLIKAEGNQLEMSKESISIINRKCHDIKYQIKALRAMDNSQKREEYINELQKAISIYDSVYHTGNEALNLLLREKTLLCDEYEIQFSCMADGSCLSFVEPDDLYVLLGNALDNALESVLKESEKEKRIISLSIGERQGMTCIHIENYANDEIVFKDGLPVTTKKEKHMHGFGMRSIQYLVEKYQGNLVMQKENDMFYLDIFFLRNQT